MPSPPLNTDGAARLPPPALPAANPRRWLKFILILSALTFCTYDLHRFLRSMEDRKPTLKRWLPFAAELGRDVRLYDDHPDYLYPPFFLVLLRPLTHLPLPLAAILWQLAKYASIIAIFRLCWDLLAPAMPPNSSWPKGTRSEPKTVGATDNDVPRGACPLSPPIDRRPQGADATLAKPLPPWASRMGTRLPLWCKVLSIIVAVRFVSSDLVHGNVNIFLCLLVVLSAWLLFRGRSFTAGLLVAVAACIKVTPALWVLYLLYKRQWRALLGVAVGLILALEVVPWLILTPQTNHALLARWYDHVVGSFVAEGKIYSPDINQSLAGVTNRLLGRPEWAPDEEPATLLDLPDAALKWLQRAIAVALLLGLAWTCRGPLPRADALAFAAEWSLIAPVTLALSGYTWTGHFCLLILGQTALLAHWARTGRRWSRDPAVLLAITAFSLWLITSDIITSAGRRWCSKMGLPLLAVLLIAAALAVLRRRCRRRT